MTRRHVAVIPGHGTVGTRRRRHLSQPRRRGLRSPLPDGFFTQDVEFVVDHCVTTAAGYSSGLRPHPPFTVGGGPRRQTHAAQVRTKHRFLRLALAFVVPFVAVAACVGIFTLDPAFAVMCGGVVGGLFLVSFLIASARVSHPLGRAFATLLLFLGLLAVVAGVVFVGCGFVLR